jgi:predicted aspartyl protease
MREPSDRRRRRSTGRSWRFAALAGVVCASVTFAADAPPVAPATSRADAPDGQVPDVIVEAPEPRYVAPTRRDKIGRIWAPVLINDQGPFRLVLDTGASNSAVNADVAAALGLPLNNDHPVLLNGVTGARQVATIPIDSLVVGDLELRSKRLPIVVDALGGAQGVLGTEGLQDKRIYIDFRHDKITIFRSHSERAPPGFTTIPIKLVGGLLLVANIRVGGVRAKAIIDTGGQATIANLPMREALIGRLRPEDIKADEITGATLDVQRGDRLVMPPIRIGDLTIRGENITVGDMYIFQHWHMTKEPALLIGMDILGLVDTLIIDYKRSELQVQRRAEADSSAGARPGR